MLNPKMVQRVWEEAQRIGNKCTVQKHPLMFQHDVLVVVVVVMALLTEGEWMEENDMYCLNRVNFQELSQDHQDWARCENNFYSTAFEHVPMPQRFHPWVYNKLRRNVHAYAAIGLFLLSRAVLVIFQNDRVVGAVKDFKDRVHKNDKNTRWGKRRAMAELLLHNGSLGLYNIDVALAFFYLLADTILLACTLLTYNPWAIKTHLGDRDILSPNDTVTTNFPPLAWCDVSQETGRLEGTYSYNCEVAANNTYVLLVVYLPFILIAALIKTILSVIDLLIIARIPIMRQRSLNIPVALSTARAMELNHMKRYTTFTGFRTVVLEDIREQSEKNTMKEEMSGQLSRTWFFRGESRLQ